MPVHALRASPLPVQPRDLGMGVLCVVAGTASIGEATYESPTEYSQRSIDESDAVQEFMDVIKSKSCGTLGMTEWAQRATEDHQIIDGLEVLASDAAPALRNIYSIVESVVSNPELNDPSKREAIKTAIEFLNFPMIMNNTIAILQKANFPQVFLPQAMSHVFAKLDKHCWSSIRDLVEPDSEVYKNLEAERESFMRSMRVTVDDVASEDTEKLLSKQQASFSRLDTPIEECFGLLHSVDNVKTALLAEVISNLQELCSWKKETSELPGNTDQRTTSQWKRLHEFLSCPFDISVDLADDAGKRDKAAVMNHRIIWMHNHCWDEIRELIHSWNPEAWAAIEMKEDILVKLASGTPPEEVTKIYKAKGTKVVIPKSLKTKTIMSNVKAGNMRGAISSLWSGDVGAETFEQKLQKIVRLVSPEVRKAATESKSTIGASLSEKLINTPNVEGESTASTETTGASPLSGQSTEIDFLHLANSLLPVNPFAAGVMGFLLSETRDVLGGISWQDTASPADRRAITDMFNAPVLITQALSEKPNLPREEQSDLMIEVLSGLYDAGSSAIKNVVKEAASKGAAVKSADEKFVAMDIVRSIMATPGITPDIPTKSNSRFNNPMTWFLASLGVAGSLAGAAAASEDNRTLKLVDKTTYEELCAKFTPGINHVYIMPNSSRLRYCGYDLRGMDRLQARKMVPEDRNIRIRGKDYQKEYLKMMRPCYDMKKKPEIFADDFRPEVAKIKYNTAGKIVTADAIFRKHKSAMKGMGNLNCGRIWRKDWIDSRQEVVADVCAKANANSRFQKDVNDTVIINAQTACEDKPSPAACRFTYCLDPTNKNVSEIARNEDLIDAHMLQDHCLKKHSKGSEVSRGVMRAKLLLDAKTKEVFVYTPRDPRIPVPIVIGNCDMVSQESVKVTSTTTAAKQGNKRAPTKCCKLKMVDDADYQRLCSMLKPGTNKLYYIEGAEGLMYCGHKTKKIVDQASVYKIIATTASERGQETEHEPEVFLRHIKNCPGLPPDPRLREVEIVYDEEGNAIAYGDFMADHREWLEQNASRPKSHSTGNYDCGAAWRNEWYNERDAVLESICDSAAPNLSASKTYETKVVINTAPRCQDPKTKQDCTFVYCLEKDKRDASIIASEVEHPKRALSLQKKCQGKEFGSKRIPARVAVADVVVNGNTRDIVMFTEKSKRYRLPTKVGHCPKLVDIRGSFRSEPSDQTSLSPAPDEQANVYPGKHQLTTTTSTSTVAITKTVGDKLRESHKIDPTNSRQLKILDDAKYQKLCSTLEPGMNQLYHLDGAGTLMYCGHKTNETVDRASLQKIVATVPARSDQTTGRRTVNEPEVFLQHLEDCYHGVLPQAGAQEVEIIYDEKGKVITHGKIMYKHREWLAKKNAYHQRHSQHAANPPTNSAAPYSCEVAWRKDPR